MRFLHACMAFLLLEAGRFGARYPDSAGGVFWVSNGLFGAVID
jgi:hypothetical protein